MINIDDSDQISTIQEVAIIGAGQMGRGIAQIFAISGFRVVLFDKNEEVLKDGFNYIFEKCKKLIQKDIIPFEEYERNVFITTSLDDIKNAELIIEAVPENFDLKIEIYKKIENVMSKKFILCTNTSSLSITKLQEKLKKPAMFLGLHFMNPPALMPLVEIISGEKSDEAIIEQVKNIMIYLKKEPVICKDRPGFVVNRIIIPMINEACLMFDEGVADATSIDNAMKIGANFPMGPLALADFIGIDTILSIMKGLKKSLHPRLKIAKCLKSFVKKNQLGRKTKKGFFEYSPLD